MTHSLATTGTVASQAPQSMRFPWQDYWSELLILPLGDGLDPGFKSMSPALAGEFFTTEPTGKALMITQSVQSLSRVQCFATPWTAAPQDSLSITNSESLLKFMSIESVMPSNQFVLWHPLLLPPSIFPSIRVFSNELVLCIRWSKYWRFSISPSNEYPGLISFRLDWFDLLAVQGTIKSLFQHQS